MSQGFTQGITVPVPVSKGGTGSATGDASGLNGYLISALDDVAWTAFTPGFTGFSSTPSFTAHYKKIGKTVFININVGSTTSNATGFTITNLPFTAARTTWIGFQFAVNNTANSICSGDVTGTTLTLYHSTTSQITGWTASGNKAFNASFFYETT